MNNFERRKFLDYLEKLLPQTDIKDYQFDNIVDFIISEFHINQKKFLKDENNIILTDTAKLTVIQYYSCFYSISFWSTVNN